ncbi:hypothetical protein [Natronobeatus ordinarius]|uniref:hypothetical protein n=1 Tax=Natronobeatus ordinarius TaxID=2963433 RepID=UPI0020CF2427|nr:hypothetical protein [Natronobeatus ordinarius]
MGTAATVAAIGTLGWSPVAAQDEDEPDLPAYSRWLTLEDDTLEFTVVDWEALEAYVEDEFEDVGPDEEVPEEFEDDPMIAPASQGLLSTYFFVALTLAPFGLGRLLEAEAFESTVERLLEGNEAFVVTGEITGEEIDEQLTAEPVADFMRQLEVTDAIGEYDVYTPVEGDADAAIAVGDEALVVAAGADTADDAMVTLETAIGAAEGDVDRATDDEEFAWLLETAGDGEVCVGEYGDLAEPTFDFDGLEDAEGVVSSLTVEDEETSTGDFAAIVDDPDEATLEAVLGASADERSIDVDGGRVTATGTWRELE